MKRCNDELPHAEPELPFISNADIRLGIEDRIHAAWTDFNAREWMGTTEVVPWITCLHTDPQPMSVAYLEKLNPEQRRAVEHGVRENDAAPRTPHVRPPRAQDQRGDLIAGGTAPAGRRV